MVLFKKDEPVASVVPTSLMTPDNCVSTSRVRAFLRLSRIATDDTIRQHLNEINKKDCHTYYATKIVPQWEARAAIIQYCSDYGARLRQSTHIQSLEADPAQFDLRTNPYAYREHQEKLQAEFDRCDDIDRWTRNESAVESIIQKQTTDVLNDKCYFGDWLGEFHRQAAKIKETKGAT